MGRGVREGTGYIELEVVSSIDVAARSVKSPPRMILEALAENFFLQYDEQEALAALSGI